MVHEFNGMSGVHQQWDIEWVHNIIQPTIFFSVVGHLRMTRIPSKRQATNLCSKAGNEHVLCRTRNHVFKKTTMAHVMTMMTIIVLIFSEILDG